MGYKGVSRLPLGISNAACDRRHRHATTMEPSECQIFSYMESLVPRRGREMLVDGLREPVALYIPLRNRDNQA
jgi:hypothetical protein